MKKKNKRGKKEVLTEDLVERRSQLGVAQVRAVESKPTLTTKRNRIII